MTRRERALARLERRREWAKSRQQKADQLNKLPDYANDWAFITQPGHIPARERINRQQERAWENQKMANHHEQKAQGIELQLERTTFSDDPDAIEQLQAKIDKAQAEQDRMKAANKCVRKKDVAGIVALGYPESVAKQLCFEPDWCGRFGFADYALTNNNANIRRMKLRIKEIERRQEQTQKAEDAGGVVITEHGEYCSITFAEKPERDILNALRGANYRWGAGSWFGLKVNLPQSVKELLP